MKIKKYSKIVSPFVQTKAFFHHNKIEELRNNSIVAPVTCEIDLVDGFCNNKCKHCFFGTNNKATPVFMDTEVIKRTIKELSEMGTKAVEFTGGGEPTTHPDISEIIKYAYDLGLDVGVVTNGLLLNKLKEVVKCLTFIRVSVDAGSRETYKVVHGLDKFDVVVNNIKEILDCTNKDIIGVGYLITPDNINDIQKAAEIFSKMNVRFIQYRPASLEEQYSDSMWEFAAKEVQTVSELYNNENLQVFGAGVKWFHLNNDRMYKKCTTSSLVAVIKANGDMPLCVLKRNHTHEIIGNIYDKSFYDNWFSLKHKNLIDNININVCRKPCKHDSYNIIYEAYHSDLFHKNFI